MVKLCGIYRRRGLQLGIISLFNNSFPHNFKLIRDNSIFSASYYGIVKFAFTCSHLQTNEIWRNFMTHLNKVIPRPNCILFSLSPSSSSIFHLSISRGYLESRKKIEGKKNQLSFSKKFLIFLNIKLIFLSSFF